MNKKEYCKRAWEHLFSKGYKIGDKLPLGIINNEMADFAQEQVKLFAIPVVSVPFILEQFQKDIEGVEIDEIKSRLKDLINEY